MMNQWLPVVISLAATAWAIFGFWAAGHALLYKRQPRSALGWMLVCLLLPYFGPLIYVVFGINRIRQSTRRAGRFPDSAYLRPVSDIDVPAVPTNRFVKISDQIAHRPMLDGNHVSTYHSGAVAYEQMQTAIQLAEQRVYLATYIFRSDSTGKQFVKVLADAAERGVDVRVLIDGAGEFYSLPRISGLLARAGIRHARFIPLRLIPPSLRLNMRNHRKLLVIDGDTGFSGGMNIGNQHVPNRRGKTPVVDAHFKLRGPVVRQLEQAFAEDWHFATRQRITVGSLQSLPDPAGSAQCRVITDGPDDDLGKLALVIQASISAAQKSVRIMTPYFLPTAEMIAAMKSAALRGVRVDIILPEKSNLPYVDWATRNLLWEILRWGVCVWYQPPPFAHTKLLIVDDRYVQIGSANIDPRSLRLNFEITVEIIDQPFAVGLAEHCNTVIAGSRLVTLEEVDGRKLPVRFRDSIAWLFSPYL